MLAVPLKLGRLGDTSMLLILCAGLWLSGLVAKLAPDTSLGRACREWLIERPAAWTGSLTPRRAASLMISGAIIAVAVAYLAPIISGEAALLLAGDALAYVEVLSGVVLVAIRSGRATSVIRQKVRGAASRVSGLLRPGARTREHTSPRRPSRASPPAAPGEPAFALA